MFFFFQKNKLEKFASAILFSKYHTLSIFSYYVQWFKPTYYGDLDLMILMTS